MKKKKQSKPTNQDRICGNCGIPMHKTLDPIIFGTPRHPRTRWKCHQCGADLPRYGDPDEENYTP